MNINIEDLKSLDEENEDLNGMSFDLLSKSSSILTKTQLRNLFPNYKLTNEEFTFIDNMLKSETPESMNQLLSHIVEFRDIISLDYCPTISHFIICLKYVSYVSLGDDIVKAYCKSHSYSKLVQDYNLNDKSDLYEEIKRLAMQYAKSKLVIQITKASDYPLHLIFTGYKYKAVERLHKEMMNAPLPKDRIEAAKALLTHLDAPQQNNTFIINDNRQQAFINDYRNALDEFANKQLELIKSGASISDVVNLKVEND